MPKNLKEFIALLEKFMNEKKLSELALSAMKTNLMDGLERHTPMNFNKFHFTLDDVSAQD